MFKKDKTGISRILSYNLVRDSGEQKSSYVHFCSKGFILFLGGLFIFCHSFIITA